MIVPHVARVVLRQPAAWVAAGLLFAAVSLALAALLAALLERRGPWLRRTATASVGALVGGLFAANLVLGKARLHVVDPSEDTDPSSLVLASIYIALQRAELALLVAGVALLACAALLAVAAGLAARRARIGKARAALLVTVASLAAVTGLGVMQRSMLVSVSRGDDDDMATHAERALKGAGPLAATRTCVVVIAILGGAAAVVLRRRRVGRDRDRAEGPYRTSARDEPARPGPSWDAIGAAAIFGAGLAAYVATRPHAADARQPLPPRARLAFECGGLELPRRWLPTTSRCASAERGVLLQVARNHNGRLDGYPTNDPADIERRLQQMAESDRAAGKPPAMLMIAAEASAPSVSMAPYLRAAAKGYGPEVGITALGPERAVATRTLGAIDVSGLCCAIPVRLDPSGVPLSSFATWADLARAAEASGPPLVIAP